MTNVKPRRLSGDVRPLSEVRAQIAAVVQHLRDTRRPVILTQRGKSAAVLLDVDSYEALLDELEMLRDVRVAEREIAEDKGIPHRRAKAKVLGPRR